MLKFKFKDRELSIGKRTYIMGILNLTCDSFYDGGRYTDPKLALNHALSMLEQGADIIDIGGESSRPGAEPVAQDVELKRVIPVIKKLSKETDVVISIDTTKSKVAQKAMESGACIINDISALRFDKNMVNVAREYDAGLVLMHTRGKPKDMQTNITYDSYDNAASEIMRFLEQRANFAIERGIEKEKIAIDPGIGFGKVLKHNLEIINNIPAFKCLRYPLLLGTSRKSFIGAVLNADADDRLCGTIAINAICAAKGADILRVHDVKEHVDAVRMVDALRECSGNLSVI